MSNHLFNAAWYLSRNPDVAAAVTRGETTAYDHFVTWGMAEERSFTPFFDVQVYLQENADVKAAVDRGAFSAVEHFVNWGSREVRPVSPFFDLPAYLTANPDVEAAVTAGNGNALDHLLNHGFAEGRPLGNGVSLAQFANDPEFRAALTANDAQAALERVTEVAPFIPTFEPPEGWQAPANTPIPVDFVPVEGETLVIPPSVEVPDDIELPEGVFEPVEPEQPELPEVIYGAELSEFATDGAGYMLVGSRNPATEFAVSQVALEGDDILEIALGAQPRGGPGVYTMGEDGSVDVSVGGAIPTLKYSVAASEGVALAGLLGQYDIKLKVDIDGTDATDYIVFDAAANADASSGALDWVFAGHDDVSGTYRIADDQGGYNVSQNIQRMDWLQPDVETEALYTADALQAGNYSVVMEVWTEGGVELVGATDMTFNIAPQPAPAG